MTLSRDFFDIGMHLCNGRYRVSLGGYASGWNPTFRSKRKALEFYEANKDDYPWVSVEDWWFVDDNGRDIKLASQNNQNKFPAPPMLPHGKRLPEYVYDARPDLVESARAYHSATTCQLNTASTPTTMSVNWRSMR